MNRSERYMSRIMFQNKVYSSDGQKYEDLFSKVMVKHNTNFKMIKPYGNIGDRKNDGFDKTTGVYFQVFAPENIENKITISTAINKLNEDFMGLKIYWHELCPIQKFYYVVNDKYKGMPPNLEQEIITLGNDHPDVYCDTFSSLNLENNFMSLMEDDMIEIIGFTPSETVEFLNFDSLIQTVDYLMNIDSDLSLDTFVESPDFERKISFNNLSNICESLLNVASYQIGTLEDYFFSKGEFVKNELKMKFKGLYNLSKEIISEEEENFADKRFMYILDNASPSSKKAVKDAVLVLMAYYFEACDIFETPIEVN